MKKITMILVWIGLSTLSYSQTAEDLFNANAGDITWLGVDFSHVKLIGDFSQIYGVGNKSSSQIKDSYFMAWNKLILNEREKYDLRGMLREDKITYDIDMIVRQNENAPLTDIESYNNPGYSREDITKFVDTYDLQGKKGIGIVFIAESLNKAETEAYFHFVAINMSDKKVLIHQRLRGEPRGFGLRNYWAGAIYDVMKQVEHFYYRMWRGEYVHR